MDSGENRRIPLPQGGKNRHSTLKTNSRTAMKNINRLFSIILLLRKGKVVTAQHIAGELQVSLRTVYRYLKTLTEGGIPIEGETGVGYFLRREFYLPPLMFTDSELKALARGATMVYSTGDEDLARAANVALAKIEASL